jgi:glutamyl-Q tRNA(Asp) synthetase
MIVTRFAPSPTGFLHLGHALAAWVAYDWAKQHGGTMLLRFEDIDVTRVRPEFYPAIEEDLRWLGIEWEGTPWRQLDRIEAYQSALERLCEMNVVYPCFCTRKEIAQMAHAPQMGDGMEAMIYPGICRELPHVERESRMMRGERWCWRLDSAKAGAMCGNISWQDHRCGVQDLDPSSLGDVIIARKDIGVSYHLAVVVDDAAQNVNWVTRGEDLLSSTHIHVMLQRLLQLPHPQYWHHPLVCDEEGKRLAKRHDALSLRQMRASGVSAHEVLRHMTAHL